MTNFQKTSAELRAAIASARHVFEGERLAEDVLHYLEQVLVVGASTPAGSSWADDAGNPVVFGATSPAAGAPVPAQTGTEPGAENASIAKQTHTPLGATPTPVAGSEWPAWARELDKVTADVKQIAAETINVFGQLANILNNVGADTFDQAAAAMAAESAKKVADAEWFASRCTSAAPAPVDATSTPTTIAHLVMEVDTTQIDAALAKAEQLKVLLAGLAPMPAGALGVSAADVGSLETRTYCADQMARAEAAQDPIAVAEEWAAGAKYNRNMGMPIPLPITLLAALKTLA